MVNIQARRSLWPVRVNIYGLVNLILWQKMLMACIPLSVDNKYPGPKPTHTVGQKMFMACIPLSVDNKYPGPKPTHTVGQ